MLLLLAKINLDQSNWFLTKDSYFENVDEFRYFKVTVSHFKVLRRSFIFLKIYSFWLCFTSVVILYISLHNVQVEGARFSSGLSWCIRPGARTTDSQWSLFSAKSQTFVLEQTIWADKFLAIWGIFGRFISIHFGTVSPLSMFSTNQQLFVQNTKPLYPHPK